MSIVCIILAIGFNLKYTKGYPDKKADVPMIFTLIAGCCIALWGNIKGVESASIDAINGENKYEIQVKETFVDGRLVKTDTLYVRKNGKASGK